MFVPGQMMGQSDSVPESMVQSQAPVLSGPERIKKLRNGAMLVRLKTKRRSIEALESKQRHSQADQVRQKVRMDNLELTRAFDSSFDFCPVYFFYSDDSEHVLNGQLDSVNFLNKELEFDPEIRVNSDYFLIAELALLEQEKFKRDNVPSGAENNHNYRNEAKHYGGANMRFHALILKDSEFNQLTGPFPYYSRTLNSFFLKKKMTEVVKVLNQKLSKYYNSYR